MFSKGERVYLIERETGMEWTVTPATVEACGKKKMILTSAQTGACLGRNYQPQEDQLTGYLNGPRTSMVLRTVDAARIEEAAEALRAFEVAGCSAVAERSPNPTHLRNTLQRLEALRVARFTLVKGGR